MTRSFALLRGAPLPAPGSFQERILTEAIIRDKNEKYSSVALFARLIATGLGIPDEYLHHLLEKYREELYQLRYNFRYESADARRLKKRLEEEFERDRLMQRLEAMTVKDKDEDGQR